MKIPFAIVVTLLATQTAWPQAGQNMPIMKFFDTQDWPDLKEVKPLYGKVTVDYRVNGKVVSDNKFETVSANCVQSFEVRLTKGQGKATWKTSGTITDDRLENDDDNKPCHHVITAQLSGTHVDDPAAPDSLMVSKKLGLARFSVGPFQFNGLTTSTTETGCHAGPPTHGTESFANGGDGPGEAAGNNPAQTFNIFKWIMRIPNYSGGNTPFSRLVKSTEAAGKDEVGVLEAPSSGLVEAPWDGTSTHGTYTVQLLDGDTPQVRDARRAKGADLDDQKAYKGTITVTWNLSGKPLPDDDVELVVEPSNYQNWVPQGSKDEKAEGNGLDVTATLQNKNGQPPRQIKADSITFELSGVSQEKGICLNYPGQAATAPEPDLKFDQAKNPDLAVFGERGIKAVREGTCLSATAHLSSYDWGTWGLLTVHAKTTDGKEVVGYLKGHAGQTEILLPLRTGDSKIADKWKADHNAIDKADDDDSESVAGNGHNGDGFTLYEEYRGLMVKGVHQYLDPERKDLIVVNKIGDLITPGIDLFASAAGCKVSQLNEAELDATTRVVNCNHSSVFGGEQHGLIIENGDVSKIPTGDLKGESMGDGLASVVPPNEIPKRRLKDTAKIVVDLAAWRAQVPADAPKADLPAMNEENKRSLQVAVAHELGHATGLLHHGKKGAADHVTIYREREKAFNEKGEPIVVPTTGMVIANIGPDQGGPASGDVHCIMCYTDTYDWAQFAALPGENGNNLRFYKVPKIGVGFQTRFCVDGAGTGINVTGNQPVSYFGDAPNGGCLGKIIIKDW